MDKIMQRTDLTTGPITGKLLRFALPMLVGNIIMQLYNVVDSVVVGQFVGSDALAAVMVGYPIMNLTYALLMGLSAGANILISQYRGAGDHERLERAINSTFSLSIIISVIMTVIGLLLTKPVLVLMGTPANILDDACIYLWIVLAGTLGQVLYYMSDGILRGMGDSRWSLYATIVSSVLNVILDLLFVIVFGWGVAGVAIATTIAYTVSGILLTVRLASGKYKVKLSVKRMLRLDRETIKQIFRLGIPSSVQSMAMTFGSFFIQAYSNAFGSDFIASNAIIQRLDGFAIMPMFGLSAAVTTFVGQNIGAGKLDRAKKGISKSIQIIVAISAVVGVVLYFFGVFFMRAFTDSQAVLDMGENGVKFLAFFYVFMGISQCLSGAVRGAGATTVPAVISTASTFVRIPFAYALAMLPMSRDISAAVSASQYATAELAKAAGVGMSHYMGLFYAMGISMAFGAVAVIIYYRFGKWQNKGVTVQSAGGAAAPQIGAAETEAI